MEPLIAIDDMGISWVKEFCADILGDKMSRRRNIGANDASFYPTPELIEWSARKKYSLMFFENKHPVGVVIGLGPTLVCKYADIEPPLYIRKVLERACRLSPYFIFPLIVVDHNTAEEEVYRMVFETYRSYLTMMDLTGPYYSEAVFAVDARAYERVQLYRQLFMLESRQTMGKNEIIFYRADITPL